MAILKCKMCGGDIVLSEDKTTGTCDHCGSTMTFPRVSDEQKLNLYNRANHFRRQNEFDKAITAYERILDQDDTDAEAHWGAVLSRYGIEYVEDPVTHERIPTCHRVQISSILSDGDYLAALENAPDTASRDLYEQEAHRIAEIQKGILSISSQEKPYDVFICYKETDDFGSRTKDSTLAQEIYYQLTNEGYKVFFSRITLEDKLGQQYEPYIFAALNSAKVMLVVGTKPEYFNAVWVKNEWSRYLALMKNDRSRLLIPCYRDMDPYDLPEELSALQSQDMSKIGFVQDLIRGVKKVLDSKKPTEPKPAAPQVTATGANIENLMKRAYLFMEDGDFASANEYLDKVLDEDAEYAPAYAGKVCASLGFRKEEQLAEATFLFADHPDWKKALRFATPQQKAVYEGYEKHIQARVEKQIRDYAYDCAMEMAVNPHADRNLLDQELKQYVESCKTYGNNRSIRKRKNGFKENEFAFKEAVDKNDPGEVTEQGYKTASEMFRLIGENKAEVCSENCLKLAEEARRYTLEKNGFIIKRLSNRTIGMEKYIGKAKEIQIPSCIRGYQVTEILNDCFRDCTELTKIIIPPCVISIGDFAFSSCESLTDIAIPDNVTSIGKWAFNFCKSLTTISIPKGVTQISDSTFNSCESLTDITLSDYVTSIGESAFRRCKSLTTISIPKGVTQIGDYAFFQCELLKNIIIPEAVTIIGKNAFGSCKSLTTITIPKNVNNIREFTFSGCTSLKNITIPENVTFIGPAAIDLAFSPELHIYGMAGTFAERFANHERIPFVDLKKENRNEEVRILEEKRKQDNRKQEESRRKENWQRNGLCTYCGGSFNLFKKCKQCGRKKDY